MRTSNGRSRVRQLPRVSEQGFTLAEMMTTVALLSILAGLAYPLYLGYFEKARIKRTIAEIRYFDRSIDAYEIAFESLPATLQEAGAPWDIRDPWGTPYQYWLTASAGNSGGGSGDDGGPCPGKSEDSKHKSGGACPGKAGESGGGGKGSGKGAGGGSDGDGPSGPQRSYMDRNPVNLDYDLFSHGPDRLSGPPLESEYGQDDIIRLDLGSFVGMAKDYF